MPTPTKGPRLGGSPTHERMILDNLASQLFEHGKITTTVTKAKRVRPLAEKLITKAKRGDLAARRQVMTHIRDKGVVHTLFTEIAPAVAERNGGYTRITKIGNRKGDNAPMAVIEIVTESVEESRAAKGRTAPEPKAAPAEAEPAATSADESRPETGLGAPEPAEIVEAEQVADGAADASEEGAADQAAPAEAEPAATSADESRPETGLGAPEPAEIVEAEQVADDAKDA